MKNVLLVAVGLFILSCHMANAKVIINEFSSATSDDWVELYNDSDGEINLSGYFLEDTASTSIKEFSNTIFPSHGYCIIDVSNRLNNKGDVVYLKNGSSQVDCVSYGDGNGAYCSGESVDVESPSDVQSASRQPNASANWLLGSITKGFSNNDTIKPEGILECYSPTPAPTATPSPSPSPTLIPTITPTIAPTTKPTITPTPESTHKKEASQPQNDVNEARAVLAANTESPLPEPKEMPTGDPAKNAVVFVLILGGILCFAGAGYPLYKPYLSRLKDRKKEYNDTHAQE